MVFSSYFGTLGHRSLVLIVCLACSPVVLLMVAKGSGVQGFAGILRDPVIT